MSVQLIARLPSFQLERVQTSLLVEQHSSLHNIHVLARMLVDRQELTTNKEWIHRIMPVVGTAWLQSYKRNMSLLSWTKRFTIGIGHPTCFSQSRKHEQTNIRTKWTKTHMFVQLTTGAIQLAIGQSRAWFTSSLTQNSNSRLGAWILVERQERVDHNKEFIHGIIPVASTAWLQF